MKVRRERNDYTISCRCHRINFILFYALIWVKNFNRERKHHEYCVVLIVFILLSLIVSRYLYSVALNVPSKIDVVLIRLKLIYRLIGTNLEHMSGKTYIKHFCCLTD